MTGAIERYGLVIADEAQDLTPMQILMLGRRSSLSLTMLGDLAQATGPHRWTSWEELVQALPGERAVTELELTVSYRVPKEILDYAKPLLDAHPASVAAPRAIRDTGTTPTVVRVDAAGDLGSRAMVEASSLLVSSGTVGVVADDALHLELTRAAQSLGIELFDVARDGLGDSISLLAPALVKGLEFDHVVVVEPATIKSSEAGISDLYVALTRPTKSLSVVHHLDLPSQLGGPADTRPPAAAGADHHPISVLEAVALSEAVLKGDPARARVLAEALSHAAAELERDNPEEAGRALLTGVIKDREDAFAASLRQRLGL